MSDIKIPCMHGWTSGCRICDLMDEVINLEQQLSDCKAENKELRKALQPFTHSDLCKKLPSNAQGKNSPIFGRDKALLVLNDFLNARKALNNQQENKDDSKV